MHWKCSGGGYWELLPNQCAFSSSFSISGRSRPGQTPKKRAPGNPGARDSFRIFRCLLLRQPLLPVLGERVDVVFGDWNQFSLHKGRRWIFALRNDIVQHIDRFGAPFIYLLRQKNLYMTAL